MGGWVPQPPAPLTPLNPSLPPPLTCLRYRYARAWWAAILGSREALAVMFTAIIAALVFGLGFIPTLGR